jgi:hypothetical protein
MGGEMAFRTEFSAISHGIEHPPFGFAQPGRGRNTKGTKQNTKSKKTIFSVPLLPLQIKIGSSEIPRLLTSADLE